MSQLYENRKVTYLVTDTLLTFNNPVTSYVIWSPTRDFFIEEDVDGVAQATDADSFLVPANTLYSQERPCQNVNIKGSGGGGTAYVRALINTGLYEGV